MDPVLKQMIADEGKAKIRIKYEKNEKKEMKAKKETLKTEIPNIKMENEPLPS